MTFSNDLSHASLRCLSRPSEVLPGCNAGICKPIVCVPVVVRTKGEDSSYGPPGQRMQEDSKAARNTTSL